MTSSMNGRLERAVESLAKAYPGPGGAAAVVKDGVVLVRHAWGFANAERRIPFTPRTLFRICSITKQFTCALALDAFPDLSDLDGDVADMLPRLEAAAPTAAHLAHNQSGLRDYWAVAMLHGAPPESPFGDHEAERVVSGTRTLHFAPGARFSYVNQNFRMLGDIVARRAGVPFADLLRARIFDRVGMETAFLAADTTAMPDGATGYEGSQAGGFRAAENRIIWTGDAGMGASLDDMIAWERHIDATRDDAAALYSRLSAPVSFSDGTPATYGFGLSRGTEFGRTLTSHGGGLRGWTSHRLYCPRERISVVVLFNHIASAYGAAMDLLAAALGEDRKKPDSALPKPEWVGAYMEPESGLAARIDAPTPGTVRLRFGQMPAQLDLAADGSAGLAGRTRLVREDGGLMLERPSENTRTRLTPLEPAGEINAADFAGRYHCAELQADLSLVDAGGALYGAVSGFLGSGRMELIEPVGQDVWTLPCPRALDYSPPGDWTLAFRRDLEGTVSGVEVGCWLARRLVYERVA